MPHRCMAPPANPSTGSASHCTAYDGRSEHARRYPNRVAALPFPPSFPSYPLSNSRPPIGTLSVVGTLWKICPTRNPESRLPWRCRTRNGSFFAADANWAKTATDLLLTDLNRLPAHLALATLMFDGSHVRGVACWPYLAAD